MKTLKAVNFSATETDLEKYARECDPKTTLIVHQSRVSINGLPRLDTAGHLRRCAKAQRETGVKTIAMVPWADEPPDEARRAEWAAAARTNIF
jgi:hypothetical protein